MMRLIIVRYWWRLEVAFRAVLEGCRICPFRHPGY
jgi:hypothetical protein